MAKRLPATQAPAKDRTPARRVAAAPEVIDLPGGQVALFNDPHELLRLSDPDLAEFAHRFSKAAGGAMRQLRRGFGLVAWAYWHRLDEGAFGTWLDDFAQVAGVESPRTIRRWMDAVVAADQLPVPAVAQLRREARTAGKTAGQVPGNDKMSENGSRPTATAASAANVSMGPAAPPSTPLPLGPSAASAGPRPEPVASDASPALLEVRGLVGKLTSTPAETLAHSCTAEALRQAHLRIQDARTIQERRVVAAARAACDHKGRPLKKLGYGTFCECGEKVR